MPYSENQSWIIEVGGDMVEKKAALGDMSLTPLERLTYCLWVADYGMCNAGDLETAAAVDASFLEDGKAAAKEANLSRSAAAFSLTSEELERRYFDLFEEMVDEIKAAWEKEGRPHPD